MSEDGPPKLLVLATNLFRDRGTVANALDALADQWDVRKVELDPSAMTEEDWDRVVSLILSTERIVTL